MIFIFKLLAGAFLVSINIFTFLLIKFQKNDRDAELLAGVASGNTEHIEYEKKPKPRKEEMQTARSVILSDEADKHLQAPPQQQYPHVTDADNHSAEHAHSGHNTQNPGDNIGGNDNPGNSTHQKDSTPDGKDSQDPDNTRQAPPSAKENDTCQDTGSSIKEDKDFPCDTDELTKKQQKHHKKTLVEKYGKTPVKDIKLILCALLGGSIGIYAALFVFKYRLRDVLMMVLVPTILALNVYVYINIFTLWLIDPAALSGALILLYRCFTG